VGGRYDEQIQVARGVYTSGQSGPWIRSGPTNGALLVVRVVSAGTGNITFRIQGREPLEQTIYQLDQSVTITTAGTYVKAFGSGYKMQPQGEAADTTHANIVQIVGVHPPDEWRVSMGKSDASAWEFGVSVRLVN